MTSHMFCTALDTWAFGFQFGLLNFLSLLFYLFGRFVKERSVVDDVRELLQKNRPLQSRPWSGLPPTCHLRSHLSFITGPQE